jgi:ComF family protein
MQEPMCRRCGAEVESVRSDCGCGSRLRALTRVRSAVTYEGPVERAVQRFKYEGCRPLAAPLARLIAERMLLEGLPGDDVVAVPLHPRRLAVRGYNQAELLARELRRRLAMGSTSGRLERVRDTATQVGQDRRRRLENVVGAFRWSGPHLRGRALLLVDDVVTTGATLEACASALKEAGAGPVIGLTVARVHV